MVCHCRMVNCGPAKCRVPPVLAPAEGIVRAGERRGNSGLGAERFAVVHAGACSSIAVFCLRFTPGVRFYCGVLPSVHACLFSFVRKKETACDILRFYSAGSRSPFVRSRIVGAVIRLCGFTSGLRVFLWRSRQRTKGTKGRGERSRRRGACALLRGHIGLDMLSAGSPLGLRAPNLRQRVFDSLDSLHAAAGLP